MEKATIRGIALALLIGAVMLPWFTLSQATTVEDNKHKDNSKNKLTVGPDRIVTSATLVIQKNDDVQITETGAAAPIRTDAESVSSTLGAEHSRAIVFFAQIRFLLLIAIGLIMTDFLFGDRLEGKDAILSIAATACVGLAAALFLIGGADAMQDGVGRVLAQDVTCESGNQDDLDRCDKRNEFTGLFGFPSYDYTENRFWGGSDDNPENKEITAKESASWRPASGFLLAVLGCVALVLTLLGSDPEKAAERKRLKEEKKAAKAAAAAAPPAMPGMAAAPMPGAAAPMPGAAAPMPDAAAAPPLPADAPPAPMAPATAAGTGYPPIPPP